MKKLISILLAAIAAFAMVGCDTTGSSVSDSNSENKPVSATPNGVVNFLDFEEYNPDFQLFRGTTGFGKISQNSDAQYVKSGKYSAKVQPIGFKGAEPRFYYPLMSTTHDFDYSDISKLEMISMYVYNAEEENKTFKIGFGNTTFMFGAQTFTMKPGWNSFAYFPDIDMLSISCDIYAVEGVVFRFEPVNAYYLKDAPSFYFDDIKLKFDEEKETQNVLEFDGNEVLGFEKDFQHYAYTLSGSKLETIPDAKIVTAAKEGITATQGEKVLKVTYKPDPEIAGRVGIVALPEKLIYEATKNIPKEEITSYAIKFDTYAATRSMADNCIATYGLGGTSPRWYTNGEYVGYTMDLTFVYGQWNTHAIPLFRSETGAIEIISYLWKGGENADTERIVYFDNFRLEKIY